MGAYQENMFLSRCKKTVFSFISRIIFEKYIRELEEFSTVMQTLDCFSGLHKCLEFSQLHSCLDEAMLTRKKASIA